MMLGGMQNYQMLLTSIESHSISFAPLVHILSTLIEFTYDLRQGLKTIELLEYIQVVCKHGFFAARGSSWRAYIRKEDIP